MNQRTRERRQYRDTRIFPEVGPNKRKKERKKKKGRKKKEEKKKKRAARA